MASFEHGTARIYYEEAGSGDSLLLLPGWGGSIEELGPLRAALGERFRVIAADLPGSGKSGPQPRTYGIGYYRDDADAFFHLLTSLNALPAHVVGFSDGGECALLIAALHPASARSVVTWGAAGSVGDNLPAADAMTTLVDGPIPPMAGFSAFLKATYGEANARVMTQSLGKTLRAMMEAGGDISLSLAGNITCPALFITGEHDFLATPPMVRELANAVTGAEYVEAAGASHPIHMELSEWLVRTVTDWLAKR